MNIDELNRIKRQIESMGSASLDRLTDIHFQLLNDAVRNNRKKFISNLKQTRDKQLKRYLDNKKKSLSEQLFYSFIENFIRDIDDEIMLIEIEAASSAGKK